MCKLFSCSRSGSSPNRKFYDNQFRSSSSKFSLLHKAFHLFREKSHRKTFTNTHTLSHTRVHKITPPLCCQSVFCSLTFTRSSNQHRTTAIVVKVVVCFSESRVQAPNIKRFTSCKWTFPAAHILHPIEKGLHLHPVQWGRRKSSMEQCKLSAVREECTWLCAYCGRVGWSFWNVR